RSGRNPRRAALRRRVGDAHFQRESAGPQLHPTVRPRRGAQRAARQVGRGPLAGRGAGAVREDAPRTRRRGAVRRAARRVPPPTRLFGPRNRAQAQGARTSPRAGARVRTRRAAPAGRPGAGGMVSRLGLRLMVGVQAELTGVLDALGLTGAPSTTLDVVRRVLATHGDLEAGLRIVERLRDMRRESVVLDTPAP